MQISCCSQSSHWFIISIIFPFSYVWDSGEQQDWAKKKKNQHSISKGIL